MEPNQNYKPAAEGQENAPVNEDVVQSTNIQQSIPDQPIGPQESQSELLQAQTPTSKPQTAAMEVHKHPHHVTHKKKWSEYLLEFLMLFLAVFLGFIAENIREHSVEGRKEKEYIHSMVEDLKKDSGYLELCIQKYIPERIVYFDSAISLLKLPNAENKSREIYQVYLMATTWKYNYVPTQRTLSQLKNNGFYLVKNSIAADALSELDINYSVYTAVNNFVHDLQNDIDQSSYLFADRNIITTAKRNQFQQKLYGDIPLETIPLSASIKTTNKEGLNQFIQKLEKYNYYLSTGLLTEYLRLMKSIILTVHILEKEYQL